MPHFSERKLIDAIRLRQDVQNPGLIRGIGDDCAVFANVAGSPWLVSMDTLVAGVHFDADFHPPFLLGRKSMAVNISDIAGMGSVPRFVLLSLCLPKSIQQTWLDKWLDGALSMLDEFNCQLIGGDTVCGPEMVVSVTILGEKGEGDVIYRSGALVGDSVYVSGTLGSAAGGLALLQQKKVLADQGSEKYQALLDAHLDPAPQIALGHLLAQSGMITAMQDISDGIATDLAHICTESHTGAVLDRDSLPYLPELAEAARFLGQSELSWIHSGGDDYQLLFTVAAGREYEVEELVRSSLNRDIYRVGRITPDSGVFLQDQDNVCTEIGYSGYEHG